MSRRQLIGAPATTKETTGSIMNIMRNICKYICIFVILVNAFLITKICNNKVKSHSIKFSHMHYTLAQNKTEPFLHLVRFRGYSPAGAVVAG